MLLEVNNLVVHYGGVIAVRGISFQVPEGAVVSLIGADTARARFYGRSLA